MRAAYIDHGYPAEANTDLRPEFVARVSRRRRTSRAFGVALACLSVIMGCTAPLPRQDDPYESINRKMFALNDTIDSHVMRPLAVGYRKITSEQIRRSIANFLANLRLPISIGNYVLQGRPKPAAIASGRLLVNTTVGILGLFDPAERLGLRQDVTDFGITLARWGLPEGPYLFLPVLGPSNPRDAVGIGVDESYLDPLHAFEQHHHYEHHFQYLPDVLYFTSRRESEIDSEQMAADVFDPYIFVRDAYRQSRVNKIYNGNPPPEVIRSMQGIDDAIADKLLKEQLRYRKNKAKSKETGDKTNAKTKQGGGM